MEQTAIYGTGTIGAGLATLLSGNGLPTLMVGRSQQSLDRCRGAVLRNWEDLISNGLAAPANRDAAMALLRFTADSALLADRSFVFEAVSEELSVKRHVYQAIERVVGDDAVIASTTSSVDAEILAGLVSRPERLLIAHPFQPAHLLPLVEVVRHRATAREITERTCSLLEYMGRQVVRLNRSVPGFLVNRLAPPRTGISIRRKRRWTMPSTQSGTAASSFWWTPARRG